MSQTFDEWWKRRDPRGVRIISLEYCSAKAAWLAAWNARGAADAEACEAVSDEVKADLWTVHECIRDVKAIDAPEKK